MRALILAAGKGTRIMRYLSGKPKCTVDIGGISLIENTVQKLKRAGIDNIGMIVGYNYKEIVDELKDYDIQFFYNPFFDVTNSIASAWFARDFIKCDEDIIIMNGDVFLEDRLLEFIINSKGNTTIFSDETRKEEADYKLYYENGRLLKYGKELTGNDITGEYIGVIKIGRELNSIFLNKLIEMVDNQKHSLWWENVIYELSSSYDINVQDIKGMFWAEVDYIEDYERILHFRSYNIDFSIKVVKMNK